MAGLVPAIHVLLQRCKKDVDGRHEAGHDAERADVSKRSPDGAKRNPGFTHSAALHAGYTLKFLYELAASMEGTSDLPH
jgi:hypothetical protein